MVINMKNITFKILAVTVALIGASVVNVSNVEAGTRQVDVKQTRGESYSYNSCEARQRLASCEYEKRTKALEVAKPKCRMVSIKENVNMTMYALEGCTLSAKAKAYLIEKYGCWTQGETNGVEIGTKSMRWAAEKRYGYEEVFVIGRGDEYDVIADLDL